MRWEIGLLGLQLIRKESVERRSERKSIWYGFRMLTYVLTRIINADIVISCISSNLDIPSQSSRITLQAATTTLRELDSNSCTTERLTTIGNRLEDR
jgi:hypothetical protein